MRRCVGSVVPAAAAENRRAHQNVRWTLPRLIEPRLESAKRGVGGGARDIARLGGEDHQLMRDRHTLLEIAVRAKSLPLPGRLRLRRDASANLIGIEGNPSEFRQEDLATEREFVIGAPRTRLASRSQPDRWASGEAGRAQVGEAYAD